MTTLHIRHRTVYRYRRAVRFGEHRLMFRPREGFDQRVIAASLEISPRPDALSYVHDVFGNTVGRARFEGSAKALAFDSRVVLDHTPLPVPLGSDVIRCGEAAFPFAYAAEDMPDLLRLIERHYEDPARLVEQFARRFLRWNGPTPILSLLTDMTHAIRNDFTYRKRFDGRTQTPAETLELGSGTCRDYAVLMMEAARSLGLAARFVSGYIYCPPVVGAPRLGGGHTHAWAQIYLPSCGWAEFDPTNGIVGNRDLVRVAVARDPRQATPLCGTFKGRAEDFLDMNVTVDVEQAQEALEAA